MTAALPPQTDTRECRLYRFYGLDPRTGYATKTLVYVGETAREPFDRMLEHLRDQPWFDTVTSWEVDDRVFPGKAAVLAAEKAAVEAERPLYNYEWNLGNPRRIEIWRAKQQRWARDDAAGKPRWSPRQRPGDRNTASVNMRADRAIDAYSPFWTGWRPWQQKLALWTTGWSTATPIVVGCLNRLHPHGEWRGHTWIASIVTLTALVWAIRHRPKRRRRR